jgi:hypothetical protein
LQQLYNRRTLPIFLSNRRARKLKGKSEELLKRWGKGRGKERENEGGREWEGNGKGRGIIKK